MLSLESLLQNNQISRFNRETIKLTFSTIEDSCKDLKQAASSVCLLDVSHVHTQSSKQQLSSNLVSKSHSFHRSMIYNLSNSLSNYVSAHLPGRKRLSVAIGISSFVKSQKPYKSFAQPLVNAIVNLFQQLDLQSFTELNLLHFLSFQNAFVKTANRILETHRLFSFGPRFSKVSFSHLIPGKEMSFLIKNLSRHLSRNSTSFQSNRFIQRLINNAQFRVEDTASSSCMSQSYSCGCSTRTATILVPLVSPFHDCLVQDPQNVNKFRATDDFFFLSDSSKAITVTAETFMEGGHHRSRLISVLNPPVIRVKSDISAILTSQMSVYFPNKLNDTIFSSCNNKKQNSNLTIYNSGAIRFSFGCNLTSANDSILIQSSSNFPLNKSVQKYQLFRNFNLSIQNSFIEARVLNQIEDQLENALVGEDTLQSEMKRLAAQTWMMRLFDTFSSYLFPSLSCAAGIVTVLVTLLTLCYCVPCCCGKNKSKNTRSCCISTNNNDEDLEKRVEKLEAFFSYCITENYHDIKTEEIRNLAKT